jgi:hypothetical protein
MDARADDLHFAHACSMAIVRAGVRPPMRTSTAVADHHRRTDACSLFLPAALAFCLSIVVTGCGSTVFDRADKEKFFYGSIIDQDGHPVAGADVSLHAGIPGMFGAGGGWDDVSTKSDRNGLFILPGMEHPYSNIFPQAHLTAPGYIIDNFAFRLELYGKLPGGNQAHPHFVRAWKLGERRLNRRIGGMLRSDPFALGDAKEMYVKIVWDVKDLDALGNPREDPALVSTTERDDWDVALSLVSDALDAGVAPFSGNGMRKIPPGMAIRVRARTGSVCQADPIFPFSAKNKAFSPIIALNWSALIQWDDRAWFRIFYRNAQVGYSSFLTICYVNGSVNGEKLCRLSFESAWHQGVPDLGVLNPSGDDCLEFDPDFAGKMHGDNWSQHWSSHPEMEVIWLKERRRDSPQEALMIEGRMRAEGKEVPPR